MKKTHSRKLDLRHEQIRALGTLDLDAIRGGATPQSDLCPATLNYTCNNCYPTDPCEWSFTGPC